MIEELIWELEMDGQSWREAALFYIAMMRLNHEKLRRHFAWDIFGIR